MSRWLLFAAFTAFFSFSRTSFVVRRFSLDAYASWSVDLRDGAVSDRYLGGFTWAF